MNSGTLLILYPPRYGRSRPRRRATWKTGRPRNTSGIDSFFSLQAAALERRRCGPGTQSKSSSSAFIRRRWKKFCRHWTQPMGYRAGRRCEAVALVADESDDSIIGARRRRRSTPSPPENARASLKSIGSICIRKRAHECHRAYSQRKGLAAIPGMAYRDGEQVEIAGPTTRQGLDVSSSVMHDYFVLR